MTDLKNLSNPEKKVAAKVLVSEGYSVRTIEKWLGISDSSISRAANVATPAQLKHFEAEFKLRITLVKKEALALVHKRLIELIPKEKKIDQLVKAGEFLEGHNDNNKITQAMINAQIKPFQHEQFMKHIETVKEKYDL